MASYGWTPTKSTVASTVDFMENGGKNRSKSMRLTRHPFRQRCLFDPARSHALLAGSGRPSIRTICEVRLLSLLIPQVPPAFPAGFALGDFPPAHRLIWF